jgi:hypothetical protein
MDGKVAVKSGVEIERFDEEGLVCSDGTRVDADLVVLWYMLWLFLLFPSCCSFPSLHLFVSECLVLLIPPFNPVPAIFPS